jgi:hypothetical protein
MQKNQNVTPATPPTLCDAMVERLCEDIVTEIS